MNEIRNITLKVIPEPNPNERTIIAPPKEKGTVCIRFEKKAQGNINMVCGQCNSILVERNNPEINRLENLVLHCNNCDAYNELTSNVGW